MISTSAPSTEIFVFLMSSFHIFPSSPLISVLGSLDLIVFSPSTNHSSQLWRCRQGAQQDDGREANAPT